MYGGLFGDLPSAKASAKKDVVKPNEARIQQPPDLRQQSTAGIAAPNVLPGLGNAGTAMAFIPTAIRSRKRPKQSSTKCKTTGAIPTNTSMTRLQPSLEMTIKEDVEDAVVHDAVIDQKGSATVAFKLGSQPDESKAVVSDIQIKQEMFPVEHDTDEGLSQEEILCVHTEVEIKHEESEPTVISNIHEVRETPQFTSIDEPGLEDESLRRLHASVTDPYDPHVPNDLLAYRERKEMEEERLRLERDMQETVERQQHLRRQLEDERQRVQASGRASDIIDHRAKVSVMGGGRGRGVNNLPAWLLQKQKEELGSATAVDNISARTVILSNLTPPGAIDVELGVEVQEECEELCGPVEDVQVKDAQPPLQPDVQVWVRFRNVGDAKKASAVFHGRIFGQRLITARRLSR